jgi:hypothetical protein
MHLLRKQDLSIYYWLGEVFTGHNFVDIKDGYPANDLTNPTVAIEAMDFDVIPWELGNRVGERLRGWVIDIFANNKAQRDEFTYLIVDALENNICVYDYDVGFPPSVTPPQIGTLDISDIQVRVVRIFPSGEDIKLRWRSKVVFVTLYNSLV